MTAASGILINFIHTSFRHAFFLFGQIAKIIDNKLMVVAMTGQLDDEIVYIVFLVSFNNALKHTEFRFF